MDFKNLIVSITVGIILSFFIHFGISNGQGIISNIIPTLNPDTVKFFHYSPKIKDGREIKYDDVKSLREAGMKRNEKVKFLIHGFGGNADRIPCSNVGKAYIKKLKASNVICVDWSRFSSLFTLPLDIPTPLTYATYPFVIKDLLPIAAKRVAEFMSFLLANDIVDDASYFHLIGHSLGAHMASIASRDLESEIGSKAGRITGLDPAGPIIDFLPNKTKLDKNDADFVDVIHSDMNNAGTSYSAGDADFYANGGRGMGQPICNLLLTVQPILASVCAHQAAVDYYARAISGEVYRGCRCKPFLRLPGVGDTCIRGIPCRKKLYIGDNIDLTMKGNFYLRVKPNIFQNSFLLTVPNLIGTIRKRLRRRRNRNKKKVQNTRSAWIYEHKKMNMTF